MHSLEGNRVGGTTLSPHSRGKINLTDVSLINPDASLAFTEKTKHFLSVKLPENQTPLRVTTPGNSLHLSIGELEVVPEHLLDVVKRKLLPSLSLYSISNLFRSPYTFSTIPYVMSRVSYRQFVCCLFGLSILPVAEIILVFLDLMH